MRRRVGNTVRAPARVALLALLALLVLIAACSPTVANDTGGADRAKAAKEATKDLEEAENKDLGCANIVTSREHRATPAPEHLDLLVDAYAVAENCWDKIVFTFAPTGDDMPPGYDITYVEKADAPRDCPIDSIGEAFLHITLSPVAEYDESVPGRSRQTYLGNLRLSLDGMHHTQLVCKRPDGEGNISWMIGLDSKRPFTVDAASDPPRVTVYVMR